MDKRGGRKKKRPKRNPETEFLKKNTLTQYELGKDKRKCWVKFPKNSYRQRVSMARRYLLFDFAFKRNIRKDRKTATKMTAEEWHNEFEKQKSLPFIQRYRYSGMHRNASRNPRDPEELIESRKAYGIQEPEIVTSPAPEVVDGTGSETTEKVVDEQETEEWQCNNWVKPMRNSYCSIEVNEVISNMRMVGNNWDGSKMMPSITVMLLESLRSGIFTQDWKIVAKSLEGLFEEAVTRNHTQHPIIWHGGMLSLLRFTNNDKEKIKEYAKTFKQVFRPKSYGRRLGCEVGIWLAQEGFFNESVLFLEEMEITPKTGGYFSQPKFRLSFNPKRDLIDLMANLIKAVFLYSIWKRDQNNAEEGLYGGSAEDLRRTGENALSTFEGLLELAQDCEADVTTFLEPLIELTLEYRSVDRAKILFKELAIRHYGNAFVEAAYLTFLQNYFPNAESEIEERTNLSKKFEFEPVRHWRKQTRKLQIYRDRRKIELPEKVMFKKLPNPAFSL